MLRNALIVLPLLAITTGCPKVNIDDPAQAAASAELTGNLAVFTYFAADKEAAKNAKKYLTAIETLEVLIVAKPGQGGFVALTDLVHKKLEERLVGEDAAFLMGAKSLSRILLMKLDQEVKLPKVEPSEELQAILDVVKAFLKGARTSLNDFIPN